MRIKVYVCDYAAKVKKYVRFEGEQLDIDRVRPLVENHYLCWDDVGEYVLLTYLGPAQSKMQGSMKDLHIKKKLLPIKHDEPATATVCKIIPKSTFTKEDLLHYTVEVISCEPTTPPFDFLRDKMSDEEWIDYMGRGKKEKYQELFLEFQKGLFEKLSQEPESEFRELLYYGKKEEGKKTKIDLKPEKKKEILEAKLLDIVKDYYQIKEEIEVIRDDITHPLDWP